MQTGVDHPQLTPQACTPGWQIRVSVALDCGQTAYKAPKLQWWILCFLDLKGRAGIPCGYAHAASTVSLIVLLCSV